MNSCRLEVHMLKFCTAGPREIVIAVKVLTSAHANPFQAKAAYLGKSHYYRLDKGFYKQK